jgi:hypothetical protein
VKAKLYPVVLVALLVGVAGRTQEPNGVVRTPFPGGYANHEALGAALRRIAADSAGGVRVRSLTKTAEGRDVWIAEIGRSTPPGQPADGPAILLVANLEGDHMIGAEVALALLERLAKAEGRPAGLASFLERGTLYVIPRLNPDGAERLLAKPAMAVRTNLRPIDRDRDGVSGEDGPDDLDGDGLITSLRVADRRASLVADEQDPRILRKADPAKGESGAYSLYAEGHDDDQDGSLNEDPRGGINLNRNWPQRWTEFDPEAGPTQVSEPEVRALIGFLFDHPEIAAVWTFGLNDNLREEPKKRESGLEDADLGLVAELSKLYRKAQEGIPKDRPRGGDLPQVEVPPLPTDKPVAAPLTAAPPLGGDPTTDGALSEWAYRQFGVLGLASRLWNGPSWAEPAEGEKAPPKDGESRWLYWNDRVLESPAFAPLRTFAHPTLGPVLVGGWKPGVRLNPPHEQVGAIAEAHLGFLGELASRLSKLTIPVAEARPLGGGLYAITAVVENTGTFPTALAQGVRTRRARPILVRLDPAGGRVVAGKARNSIEILAGAGGRRTLRWIVAAGDEPRKLTIEAATPAAGTARAVIELE